MGLLKGVPAPAISRPRAFQGEKTVRMRPVVPALLVVSCAFASDAHADRHKAGPYAAYAVADRSRLNGVAFGSDFTFDRESRVLRRFSIQLAGSYVSGEHEGGDLRQLTGLLGLRYAFPHGRVEPYALALVGRSREDFENREDRSSWAGSFALGFDLPLGGREAPLALRLQGDLAWLANGEAEWYPQVTAGFVWRIE